MRRKSVFLGYFALFLVSVFASCQLLNSILSQNTTPEEPNIVQETPQSEQYDRVLSPEIVASLPAPEIPSVPLSFVQVDINNPLDNSEILPEPSASSVDFEGATVDPTNPNQNLEIITENSETVAENHESANPNPAQNPELVDIPLTGAPQNAPEATSSSPRKVSIFRTILAVLLAVTALTLAGFGLYQTYDYLAPFIDDYLQRNYH